MDKSALEAFVGKLPLREGDYVLFGGSCLAIRDLRAVSDIDLFVTPALYQLLARQGWQEKTEEGGAPYLTKRFGNVTVDVIAQWRGGGWQPDIARYLAEPEVVDDLPFMPLRELYEWKKATRRPRDIEDMNLIEEYWADR